MFQPPLQSSPTLLGPPHSPFANLPICRHFRSLKVVIWPYIGWRSLGDLTLMFVMSGPKGDRPVNGWNHGLTCIV